MNTKTAIANASGFCDSSILGTSKRYVPAETANKPISVPVRLNSNLKNLFLVTPIRLPTNWPFSYSHGDIKIGIITSIPIRIRLGK